MAQLKVGDVVEILTSKGFAYAQYSHKHKQYGALLRVYNQTHPARPTNLDTLVKENPSFLCFFPLSAAIKQNLVQVVGNYAVPEKAREFPTFRAGVVDPTRQKVAVWWLWDGEKEWKIGELTGEQKKLSIRGVWNDTLLIERIEANWTPETDLT